MLVLSRRVKQRDGLVCRRSSRVAGLVGVPGAIPLEFRHGGAVDLSDRATRRY